MKLNIKHAHLPVLACCYLLISNSFAAMGDTLIITGDIVNLRTAPSTDADTPIKLLKDQKVIEIQRQDEWVEIETGRDDIKTGWVHKSLVSNVTTNASSKQFNYFMQRFNEHNETRKNKHDIIYFSTAKDQGDGTIELIATEDWLQADYDQRGQALNTIFKLWSDIVPVGKSMSVIVFDEQGEQHMIMLR